MPPSTAVAVTARKNHSRINAAHTVLVGRTNQSITSVQVATSYQTCHQGATIASTNTSTQRDAMQRRSVVPTDAHKGVQSYLLC